MPHHALIPDLLEKWSRQRPDQVFIRIGPQDQTYAEMRNAIAAAETGLLGLGLKPGDRIAITCPTSIESIVAIFAAASLGAIVAPLNIFLKGDSLEYQLKDAGCTAVVTDGAGLQLLAPLAEKLPSLRFVIDVDQGAAGLAQNALTIPVVPFEQLRAPSGKQHMAARVSRLDPFAIIYTSGTTGLPKGCVISHAYALHWASCTIDLCGIVESDVMFTAAPLFHVSGMNPLLIALTLGIAIAYEPAFSATNYLARAKATGGTVAVAVGWIPETLLKRPPAAADRDHPLRVMSTIQITPAEQEALEQRFGIVACTQQFGQTECWPISYTPFAERTITPYAGKICDGLIVEIHDDDGYILPPGDIGEIVVRPRKPGVMFDQYWSDPARSLEVFKGLWFHTGDLGRFVDGQIQYVDRKKDSLRRRGENVSSFELERTISRYEEVREVAVIGVKLPDEIDESIKAFLIVDTPEQFQIADFVSFLARELPYYAVPQLLEFVAVLPRNASGRVMKDQLRKSGMTPATLDLIEMGHGVGKAQRR